MQLAIVVLSVLIIVAVPVDSLNFSEPARQAISACAKQVGATPEDEDSLIVKMEVPQTRPAQCFAACVGKRFNVMIENKLCVDVAKRTFPKFRDMFVACAFITDADECEAAHRILECLKMVHSG